MRISNAVWSTYARQPRHDDTPQIVPYTLLVAFEIHPGSFDPTQVVNMTDDTIKPQTVRFEQMPLVFDRPTVSLAPPFRLCIIQGGLVGPVVCESQVPRSACLADSDALAKIVAYSRSLKW